MIILSIIVPVFNAEKYIRKCIVSLSQDNQDLKNYEIIIVNDGSTDSTKEIILELSLKYSNIIILNQENKGLGGARNSGIQISKGKYIIFVDSDDYLLKDSLKLLVDKIEKDGTELLYANFQKVDLKGNIVLKTKEELRVKYSNSTVDASTFLTIHYNYILYAVLFVYKKEFLKKISFKFRENTFMEDLEGIPKVISQANRISMLDYPFYFYVQTPTSIMRDPKNDRKRAQNTLDIIILLHKFKKNIQDPLIVSWFDGLICKNVIAITKYVIKNQIEKNIVYRSLKASNIFPIKSYNGSIKDRIIAIIINFNWTLSKILFN